MTHSNSQIADALHEALNGLSIGWQLANVKDNTKRNELQAPIIAGQQAILALLKDFER
jgi:hypothetical protein